MRITYSHIAAVMLCLVWLSVFAETPHHALIEVYPESADQLELLKEMKLDFVAGESREDIWIVALPEVLSCLEANNISFDVRIDDMENFYVRRAGSEGHLDDMGGYKTFSEIEAAMDAVHSAHPDITTEKFSLGTSHEGNPIWCMKLSDNPDIDEDEIELLFTSAIHSREVITVEVLFTFVDYLTENYSPGSGNEATYLLDNREFYWIPCINPDGYLYNELTHPDGGGMWRKNRRDNGGGEYGVDLNRNWGIGWGFDDEGSSPDSSELDYRGPYPFSEPEADALKVFIESRHFIAAINYHSYSNLILYPWGPEHYRGGLTEDDDIYSFLADSMSYLIEQVNGVYYEPGTVWQALYYATNGDANDWCYGEQLTKKKIFSFTIEVGSSDDGFWPAPSRIQPLCRENLPANLFISRYAENLIPPDQAIRMLDYEFTESFGDGDGIIESGEEMALSVTLKNTGNLGLTLLQGQLQSLSFFTDEINAFTTWSNAAVYDTVTTQLPFLIDIDTGVPEPFAVEFSLHVTAYSGLDTTLFIRTVVGPPLLDEDFEEGAPGWTHEAGDGWLDQWHLSGERSRSGGTSYKCGDSGSGYYANLLDARLISPVVEDLPQSSVLSFWSDMYAQRSGSYPDSAYDGGVIEVSVDGGAFTSVPPITGYTHTFRWFETGTMPHTGPMPGQPCLSGFVPWEKLEVDLSAYAGHDIQIQFRFGSDSYSYREGWYIDDVKIAGVRDIVLVEPQGLIVKKSGSSLVLRWDEDINPLYHIYSSNTPDGEFENYIGSTTHNIYIINNLFEGDNSSVSDGAISPSHLITTIPSQQFFMVKGALPVSE